MYQGGRTPSKSVLSCLYSNVSSLKNKINELKGLVEHKKPDIIGLTEVWMKEHIHMEGYHPAFRCDRSGRKGGGVMILVQESFKVTECNELNDEGFEEAIWCKIHLGRTEELLVGVCYRSRFNQVQIHVICDTG